MNFLILSALATLTAAAQQPAAATDVYQVVFLKPDPARKPLAKEEGARIQTAHMANIHSMADRGILVSAGPFDDKPTTISGIFVFKTGSLEEAQRIAAEDPTVVEHRNTVEVVTWRGPKGIGEEYFRLHKLDPKMDEGMGVHPYYLLQRTNTWDEHDMMRKKHEAYVAELKRSGKVAAWGPVTSGGTIADIVIFDRIPDAEAADLAAADPAVKQGLYRAEGHRWWSSAHVLPR